MLSSSIMLLSGVIPGGGGTLLRGGNVSSTCLTPSLTLWPMPCFEVDEGVVCFPDVSAFSESGSFSLLWLL